MDALNLDSVHLVGASMGGFIAQTIAISHPKRIRSLTLIMTSTGSRRVGNPKPALFSRLTKRRVVADRASAQAMTLETFRIIGSKGYAFDEQYRLRWQASPRPGRTTPAGTCANSQPSQLSRTALINCGVCGSPALVIHGLHDPLVAFSGGLAAARSLRNAKFVGTQVWGMTSKGVVGRTSCKRSDRWPTGLKAEGSSAKEHIQEGETATRRPDRCRFACGLWGRREQQSISSAPLTADATTAIPDGGAVPKPSRQARTGCSWVPIRSWRPPMSRCVSVMTPTCRARLC